MRTLFRAFRLFYWDIRDRTFRFSLRTQLLGHVPGRAGFYLRQKWLPGFFDYAGTDIRIFEHVRFRGAHKLRVGNRVQIGVGCFIQAEGGVEIGDDVILGPDVKIWSMNHAYADPDTPIQDQGYNYRNVKIGNDVWIGAGTFIMPGADIGAGTVVSAQSVVGAKTVPPYSVLAGNPARRIGSREKKESGTEQADTDHPAQE